MTRSEILELECLATEMRKGEEECREAAVLKGEVGAYARGRAKGFRKSAEMLEQTIKDENFRASLEERRAERTKQ